MAALMGIGLVASESMSRQRGKSFLCQRNAAANLVYAHGVARLPRGWIDQLNALPGSPNALSYERAPLPDNPYHDNIVFRAGLQTRVIRMIAGALALGATVTT